MTRKFIKIIAFACILTLTSCKDNMSGSHKDETEYIISFDGSSIAVYDGNDTIYLDSNQMENLIKIVSDKSEIDSIRNSVKRHLDYKNLAHKHIQITNGGGQTLTVSIRRKNTSLKISQSGMTSISEYRNLAGLFLLLEKNHKEIDRAF